MEQIIVTGAEGFIGSNLVNFLNNKGIDNIILVDSADNGYLKKAHYSRKMTIEEFILYCLTVMNNKNWPQEEKISTVFHLGAMVDTSSSDRRIIDYNLTFSKTLFNLCSLMNVPLFYASSAAVYGKGRKFSEDEEDLHPLNLYAESKYLFDKYVMTISKGRPEFWYGFRLFNVYGPNELHKGRMASSITQIFLKTVKTGEIELFKSIDPDFMDGHQMRDFIHVDDVIREMYYFYSHRSDIPCGIYNLGTGKAISFMTVADQINKSLDLQMKVKFINTPSELCGSYQSFTQADMSKTLKYVPYFNCDDPESVIQKHYSYLKEEIKYQAGSLN